MAPLALAGLVLVTGLLLAVEFGFALCLNPGLHRWMTKKG